MNVKATREFFEEHNVVAMRAYKSEFNPQVERELVRLGNTIKAIPYYAVYSPGMDAPITFTNDNTLVMSPERIRAEVQKALNAAKGTQTKSTSLASDN